MFKVGDKVKFKKSSLDSGMIDSDESGYYKVISACSEGQWVNIYQNEWLVTYHQNHFEHVKEETMNTNEEETQVSQPIAWEVGQEVWCLLRGKGRVNYVATNGEVDVRFEGNTLQNWYSADGKLTTGKNRTLFFSEPKIEAELFPPKKPFIPVFKKEDVVVVKWADTTQVLVLSEETENKLKVLVDKCGIKTLTYISSSWVRKLNSTNSVV
jgi:hypothetical protein